MGANENGDARLSHSADFEKENKHGNEGESDYEPARDSLSSHSNEDCNKVRRDTRVPKQLNKKESGGNYLRPTKVSIGRQEQRSLQYRSSNNGLKKSQKPSRVISASRNLDNKIPESTDVRSRSSSDLSEEIDDKSIEEVKEIDILDGAPICEQSVGTDDSLADAEENNLDDVRMSAYQKVEEMQDRIEKLEEELREVAALEISIYSIVPEHGSSAHKVHTPARRLARLYLHACKHWSQDKRASVAKNTVSGLVLVAKSCGNDVPRLMFWLSNTVVLREIVSRAFGYTSPSSALMRQVDSSICAKKSSSKLNLRSKSSEGKQGKVLSFIQQVDDWQETSTFITALEKLESWIFSRAVESVWWQALTPHMQSPIEDLYNTRSIGQLLGPVLGDPEQGNFSVNWWRSAFHDAFSRLCPVRSGGHECGCVPALARLVMEQCIHRLDIAMFNAILRESANEMPTDPISDPIVDSKVLPLPAGDLSFGSGAQLKNSIGNWARMLADLFGINTGDFEKDEVNNYASDHQKSDDVGFRCFCLLNELSDLLMLPKDMLLDKTIRKEVCPSIGLSIITRILCNFTPDDFCPDPVPGIVLEELSFEGLIDGRLTDNEHTNIFPRSASPVIYFPPSPTDVAEKIADCDANSPNLQLKASVVLRRGYTSDEDLSDLDDPLASLVDRTPPVSPGDKANPKQNAFLNTRYSLLREVWCE
ncbi:hypothetical protein HPP92_018944 [Vanilla planifolia]|uniref:Dilute domain-containing protein n=1 Tax=Vanilla planifolia TaxID=51239 RepID=A0A835UL95_VANPL|nr:hypothetical protein HPP92_018944 [Vanilla planifolia]